MLVSRSLYSIQYAVLNHLSRGKAGLSERRAYDGTTRRARAAERRELVLSIARKRFLDQGYGRTSLAGIATEAGVSMEYLHKAFDGKAGLVRAIYERSLLGSGPIPAPERSDEAQAQETDARALMHRFGGFMAEISPVGAPLHALIRDAAASGDPSMIRLFDEVEQARYERMLHNARQVEARGFLRPEVTAERAAEVFWAVTGSGLYESLVVRRGWSGAEFASFVGEALVGALVTLQ
jgi:AcrR family transcriptional regulator